MTQPKAVLMADPFGVQIGVFGSEKAAIKYFAKEHGVNMPSAGGAANASAHSFIDGDKHWYALVLPKGLPMSKVAHEVVHIADFIMVDMGVPCNAKNTEIRAYLVDYLLSQLWDE